MRTLACALLLTIVLAANGVGQGLPAPGNLQQAMDDIEYAELLNAVQLTPEQLGTLLQMRAGLQWEADVDGELVVVLTKMLAAVLTGMSRQAAMQALGAQQQVLNQAQQGLHQAMEQSITELGELLTKEQKDALAWFSSPGRGLERVVDAVAQMRAAEDAQWNQVKQQLSQDLSQMSAQTGGEGGASAAQIMALLDQARAMDDATFEAKRATLAQEWLPTILPNVVQMMQTPQFQQQQFRQTCQRLLTYPRGGVLVEAKRDATGAQ